MAELRQKASKNLIYKIGSEVVSRLSMSVFFLVLTNLLGPEKYGAYTSVNSFFPIFAVVTDLGINLIFARNVNQNPQLFSSYFSKLTKLKFLLSFIYVLICVLFSTMMEWTPSEVEIIWVLLIYIATFNLYESFLYFLVGTDDLKNEARLKLFNRIASSLLGIIVLLIWKSLYWSLFIQLFVNLTSIVITLLILKRKNASPKETNHQDKNGITLSEILKMGLPIAFLTLLTSIYYKIDVVMLKMFRGDLVEIGNYGTVLKVQEMVTIIPSMIMGALFPILNKLFSEKNEKFELVTVKTIKVILIYSIGMSIGGFFLSKEMIPFLFGDLYQSGGKYAQILFWSFTPLFFNMILLNISFVYGNQIFNLYATLISVGINVMINYFLIPSYGAVGAALATIIAELSLTTALLFMIKNQIKIKFSDLDLVRLILPFGVLIISLFMLDSLHFIVRGLISVLLFAAALLGFKGINQAEVDMIKEMFWKKK